MTEKTAGAGDFARGQAVLRKNDAVTLTIEDMGADGEGIGKYGGMTFFVKDAVIGDEVEARVTKLKKSCGYARLLRVVRPSEYRVEPECPIYRQCGGCQLQALSYERQLLFKEEKVKNCLVRIGGFSREFIDSVTEPIVGADSPRRYRNKAQFPIGKDRDGNPVAGFYAARTHSIIPVGDCLLGAEENALILKAVLSYMRAENVSPYDERTGTGLVRHILIRRSASSGEWLVCLIINGENLPHSDALVTRLRAIGGMAGVSVNVNKARTNVILGGETRTVWGSSYITDEIRARDPRTFARTGDAVSFRISPQSFYQVNPAQTEKLYSIALDFAGLTGTEAVWDLYCGIGTISLFLAKKAGMVYGVEVVPGAIEDARGNAARNGVKNARFFVGRAEEILPKFYAAGREGGLERENAAGNSAGCENGAACGGNAGDGSERGDIAESGADMRHPDVIVVDPPRKGCDEKCLAAMAAMQPERIVYVSCDPATLARDLKYLCGRGYEVRRARAVDMFAETVHVETVVLMSRVKE